MSDLIKRKAAIAMSEKIVDEIEQLTTLDIEEKKVWARALIESILPAEEEFSFLEPESRWISCNRNMPNHHNEVLVSGIESINNVRVYKVMIWDKVRWRPTNYAPSITWDKWMEIPE